jgi:hypothetical protein
MRLPVRRIVADWWWARKGIVSMRSRHGRFFTLSAAGAKISGDAVSGFFLP